MQRVKVNQEKLNKLMNDGWSWRDYSSMGGGDPEDKTFILVDANGNEIVAVMTDEEVVLDATANDIREGKMAATDDGVTLGTKEIPSYYVTEGFKLIPNGSEFRVSMMDQMHAYTKLQAIFCPFNSNMSKSVSAEKVAINDVVYNVQSTVAESAVTIDDGASSIVFGITNTSGKPYVIRYFTYKEMY